MRIISAQIIKNKVAQLCLQANFILPSAILKLLKSAYVKERDKRARDILAAIIKNAQLARKQKLAICQDTGLPCVFVELGQDVFIRGNLKRAIQDGIVAGYKKGSLRNSIIQNPLLRGKPGYYPAMIHIDIVPGNRLKLTVMPKGFGCENKTQLKMFRPTAEIGEIKKFIIEVVESAGADACPPYVVGVGMGGSADYACLLAKKALLRTIDHRPLTIDHKLERDLLRDINKLSIGPMGLGGKITALTVNIKNHPTHIAGLPVAVNLSCHALRSARAII
jgi:fumarate hydratase subunit alpha